MTKPFKFQKQGVLQIEKHNGRLLLADEMGLGKTLSTLLYLKRNKTFPAVVVCPASLKWVWRDEAKKHCKIRSVVINGQTPKKLRGGNKLYIINYEILHHWTKNLAMINPSLLIVDECHFQKSRKAKRTKAVHKLAKNIPHIIPISGTPLTNRPAELYTTLKLLWPKEFPSFLTYAWEYCAPSRRPWGWDFSGASNLNKLHKKLKKLGMLRRLKKDVLPELPDKIREVVKLPLSKECEYLKAENNFLSWLQTISKEKAKRAARAEKLVKIGYLKRLAAELKMPFVFDWIDNFLESSDDKLILICTQTKILQLIYNRYKKISVMVDGSVTGNKREKAVNDFQNNKNIRLIVGNIGPIGTGLTLVASNHIAFIELSFVPAEINQAEDRINRIGQTKTSIIYYLIAKDTIEEHLCKIIQNKQHVLSTVLDGDESVNAINIYDLLEKEIYRKQKRRS